MLVTAILAGVAVIGAALVNEEAKRRESALKPIPVRSSAPTRKTRS